MAEALSDSEIRRLLADGGEGFAPRRFDVLHALSARLSGADEEDEDATDLLLRAADRRDNFGSAATVLDALLRQRGLFPYLDQEHLSDRDLFAVELNRPTGLEDIVLHRVQTRVYNALVRKRSVVLSAPTSFGKSVLIDAVIASEVYKSVLVVVPTLALIDETRRRLTERFGPIGWKILTHHSQRPKDKNIYVLTAERVAEFERLPAVDFFVLDEFYKLSPDIDHDRSSTLNQVLYHLLQRQVPFYMLGPNIEDVPAELKARCEFIKTDFKTVASEIIEVPKGVNDLERLHGVVQTLDGPTLIYCSSPQRAREVAKYMLDSGISAPVTKRVQVFADWTAAHFHPEWTLVRALRSGIGIHHGRMPRSLGQYQVRLFNDEQLKFLVCTSTLIEGVNTRAKNVLVLDNKLATKKYDYFTFNNIKGRAGRMFQHFIGRVYLFHPQPVQKLPLLDVPAVSLGESAPDSLLLQAELSDVRPSVRKRLSKYLNQNVLSLKTLKANATIEPDGQLDLAKALYEFPERYHPLLRWTGFPPYAQRKALCELIWTFLIKRGSAGVFSGAHLAVRLGHTNASFRDMIDAELRNTGGTNKVTSPDDAVENVLEFVKTWATYKFPSHAFAVDRIQKEIFAKHRLPTGDYTVYATQVQNLFSDPVCMALEEYGVPFQIAKRFEHQIAVRGDLDASLEKFRNLHPKLIDGFEQEVVTTAQKYL